MFRLGFLTSTAAALALAAGLMAPAPAAAHDSGRDFARALAGIVALGIIAKGISDRRYDRPAYRQHHKPKVYYHHYGHRHHAGTRRHHHRHLSHQRRPFRYDGYYYGKPYRYGY